MRLDKLTIGSDKDSPTHCYRNLKNISINFDEEHWVTVVIGWNGTGKSNVLEALAIIFRDLISKVRKPAFAYRLRYFIGTGTAQRAVEVDADPDRARSPYIIHVDENRTRGPELDATGMNSTKPAPRGRLVSFSSFVGGEQVNLPRYVFSYYSGESPRMADIFRGYLESYDAKLRKGADPGSKRLFYALPVHSQFVLLAFLTQDRPVIRQFLIDKLGLDPKTGLDSILFVLRKPPWNSTAPDGDIRFWNARGIVRDFLSNLYEVALAPIRVKRNVAVSLWNKKSLDFLYLYVKNIQALRLLVGRQEPAEFFRDLESTYVSELIDEVRIRVKLKNAKGGVTFRDLSEGEQQLLTVLGLLHFTATDESLFLLDEPDTHLNPRWCADYLSYLKQFGEGQGSSPNSRHIVLTTHNPLSVAELVKQQVQILSRDRISGVTKALEPDIDPRGMGYAGIVTSDMFGLDAALDRYTMRLLERKRQLTLETTSLTKRQSEELGSINAELDSYGFTFSMRDPLFEAYLRRRFARKPRSPTMRTQSSKTSAAKLKIAKKLMQKAARRVRDRDTDGGSSASN